MYAKARCAALALLVMLAGLVSATENYMDYGGKRLYSCRLFKKNRDPRISETTERTNGGSGAKREREREGEARYLHRHAFSLVLSSFYDCENPQNLA